MIGKLGVPEKIGCLARKRRPMIEPLSGVYSINGDPTNLLWVEDNYVINGDWWISPLNGRYCVKTNKLDNRITPDSEVFDLVFVKKCKDRGQNYNDVLSQGEDELCPSLHQNH